MATTNPGIKDSLAVFRTSQGVEIRAPLARVTPYDVAFEVYSPETVIRTSEVLEEFKILINDQPVYSGRAVVRNVVNTGTSLVCSVDVDDFCFDARFFAALGENGQLSERFKAFLQQWQGVCKVLPEFKVAVADIQTFLVDLRRWLE